MTRATNVTEIDCAGVNLLGVSKLYDKMCYMKGSCDTISIRSSVKNENNWLTIISDVVYQEDSLSKH